MTVDDTIIEALETDNLVLQNMSGGKYVQVPFPPISAKTLVCTLMTSRIRVLPSILHSGAPKCGTWGKGCTTRAENWLLYSRVLSSGGCSSFQGRAPLDILALLPRSVESQSTCFVWELLKGNAAFLRY